MLLLTAAQDEPDFANSGSAAMSDFIQTQTFNQARLPHLRRFFSPPGSKRRGIVEAAVMYLSGESLLVILLIGAIAGWLAGQIVQGTGFGLLGDIVIGIVGAFIASFLFPRLGLHLGAGIVAEIIAATIGAVLLLVIVRLVRRGGRW
jgi:uncharacterized membrane protein YeaQ/YmgE (transglycosylase-associated protein family)